MLIHISKYLNSEGKVVRWPKRNEEKLCILKYLLSKFEPGKDYSEKEVNAILSLWHVFHDHAMLRRELFNKFLLDRTLDGSKYWVQIDEQEPST